MSPLPRKSDRIDAGVYRDRRTGLLWITAQVTVAGKRVRIGPRMAELQGAGESAVLSARQELLRRCDDARAGRLQLATRARPTVEAYTRSVWAVTPCLPRTQVVREYRAAHWLCDLGSMYLDAVTVDDVRATWERLLGSGMAPNSLQQVLSSMRTTFSAAADEGLIARSPVKAARLRAPVVEAPSHARIDGLQLGQALAYFKTSAPQWFAFFAVQVCLGMRVGEVLAMVPANITREADGAWLTIPVQKVRKRGARIVPLSGWLVEVIEAHQRQFSPESLQDDARTLWPGRASRRKPYTYEAALGAIERGLAAAGMEGGTHDMRRTFVATAASLGIRPRVRKAIDGHAAVFMDERYDGVFRGELREAVEVMSAYVRAAVEEAAGGIPTGILRGGSDSTEPQNQRVKS